jgi:ABC-type Fe3+ transport system substrate-binding protein
MVRWLKGLAAMLAVALCGAAARAETLDQLYAKAKPEKTLLLYGAGPTAPYERWTKEFMQRFPGIEVVVTGGFSNVLDTKINEQIKAGKMEVDIAFFQTVQDFVAWKKEGVLLPFKVDGSDKIAPEFRDKDGAFTTTSVNTISYVYNTKLVASADVPTSALDFLKPQFRGKLVTAYPADDDATLYAFYTIVQKYGWGWMDKYMANKPNFIQGHLGETKSIVDGINALTFDGLSSSGGALKAAGAPIDFAFAAADPTPAFILTAGIFKGSPHPNVAKLYLDWYMAKEQQSRLGTFSARTDVPPPPGFKPLAAYKLANHYRDFVTNETRMVALRKRFEAYTGPVVNQGGVK